MFCEFTEKNYPFLSKKKLLQNKLIIEKLRKDRKNIIEQDIQYTITNIKINNINKYADCHWVYKDGLINCLDELTEEVCISWPSLNTNLENKIYLKCTKKKLELIKKRLLVFLQVMNYIKGSSSRQIKLYLILSNLKKVCDYNDDIHPKHVNSGYTDIVEDYIFIWREEEFEKVTFHELIHLYDKDHRNEDFSEERYYEALTDMKGIYFNIIYISILTKIKIEILLNLEVNFINNQALYIESILKKNNEHTSAFSYYILKAKLFNYIINEITEKEWNDIFIKNINGIVLLKKIFNNKIIDIKYNNFNSARMTFFQLL